MRSSGTSSPGAFALLGVTLALVAGCAPRGPGPEQTGIEARLEDLLDLEDTRSDDRAAWSRLLAEPDPRLRGLAARGVGRVRNPALAGLLIDRLEAESAVSVREELVFALGQLRVERSRDALERIAAEDGPAGLRARALEALGKLGGGESARTLSAALTAREDRVVRAGALALARALGRRAHREPPVTTGLAREILERLSGVARSHAAIARQSAAYALSEVALEGREAALVDLLADHDPTVRLFSVRGIARVDGAAARRLNRLSTLLEDADPYVAASAADGLAAAHDPAAIEALVEASSGRGRPERFHVRAAAVRALGTLAHNSSEEQRITITRALVRRLSDLSATVRREALVELARVSPTDADGPVRAAASDPDPWDRAAAARAAVHLGSEERRSVVERLLADRDARVVAAALAALGDLETPPEEVLRRRALSALARTDVSIRATALSLLARFGRPSDAELVERVLAEATGDEQAEVRLEALSTLTTLAGGAAEAALVSALADPVPAVAERARALLADSGAAIPAVEPPVARRSSASLGPGEGPLEKNRAPRAVVLTNRGELEIELLAGEAPRHVKSFLDLARTGFYDGLPVHRVVSGFVVQGLDPRGDGWGTGGVFLRDEINPVPFDAGVVGMPNAGPDTAGCQFFITLVPTPHLDGNYTAFGRVVRGRGTLDTLEVGDTVVRVLAR
jgi:cyclophilin family peptidyl-prolyl cis-trans isomerase/HEAT repeat protein